MAYSDRELLARLIQCEAGGEGEDGMKAVAGVVMNRVHAKGGEYARVGQGSIRNIIFQPYQFVCASETEGGAYNPQNIYNMRPEQIHYDIADWAIAGNRLRDVADSLWFYNPFGPTCRSFFPSKVGYWQTRIGDHCFYNPTDAYLLCNTKEKKLKLQIIFNSPIRIDADLFDQNTPKITPAGTIKLFVSFSPSLAQECVRFGKVRLFHRLFLF